METAKVRFIPDQTDGMGASPPTARNNPLYLMWHDLRVLCSLLSLVPKLYLPWSTMRKSDELYMKWPNAGNVLAVAGISLLGFLLIPAVQITFLLAPGYISLPASIAALAWLMITCASLHGPTVVRSVPGSKNRASVTFRPDEMWVFVNGVLSTSVLTLVFWIPVVPKCPASQQANTGIEGTAFNEAAIASRGPLVGRSLASTTQHMA